jgi:hypothetical protein
MAGVSISHMPVQGVRDTRVRDMRLGDTRLSGMLIVSGMLIMTSDSRRIRGG